MRVASRLLSEDFSRLTASSLIAMAKKTLQPVAKNARPHHAVRKSLRLSLQNDNSNDYFMKLPAEVIHMICVYLKPTDLASLRLLSRHFAPIALQHMVSQVYLILVPDSFKQLEALSKHPTASKNVTSLFFEADKMDIVLTRLTSRARSGYSKKQIVQVYGNYKEILDFQRDPEQEPMQSQTIAEAMKKFPNLKELVLSTSSADHGWPRKLFMMKSLEAATQTHSARFQEHGHPELLGVQQMRSLLLGAHSAGLKVEKLDCKLVSWRIMDQDNETFAKMRDAVSNIKEMRLHLYTCGLAIEERHVDDEYIRSFRHLKKGSLKDFVTAAPHLVHLSLEFQSDDYNYFKPTSLKHLVGEHYWPFLKTLHLNLIRTSEEDLVSLCSRHASTLKSLHLANIELHPGDWFPAFDRLRPVLALESLVVDGPVNEEIFDLGFKKLLENYFKEPYCPGEKKLSELWKDRC